MTRLLCACAALSLAACAPTDDANGDGIADAVRNPNQVSQIAPSTPVGTVSGFVVNTLFAGLEGVQVAMVLGGGREGAPVYRTTTNADGAFSFIDVPGGSQAQLTFTKSGYSSARVNAAVPAGTANIPINDGNGNVGMVSLTQLTSTLRVRVYTASGRPARGAAAVLEVSSTAFQTTTGGYGGTVGNFSATATVDDMGLLTFTGVPDVQELLRITPTSAVYGVSVGALDEDMDGRFDSLGAFANYTPRDLFSNPDRTIVLGDARTAGGLSIIATNIETLTTAAQSPPYRNMIKGNDPINVVFNQAIAQTDMLRTVTVTEEDCETLVPVNVTNRAPNALTIAPNMGWTLGKRYNISVRVTGLESGTTNDFIGYFFAIDPGVPRNLLAAPRFTVQKAAGNTGIGYQGGDTLFVTFELPILRQAGQAVVQVNLDLNGDSNIDGTTSPGEFSLNPTLGFALSPAEITLARDPLDSPFTCRTSGYSSRWTFSLAPLPGTGLVPSGTRMRVHFPSDQLSSDTFQTAWGQPVTLGASINSGDLAVQ